MRKSSCVRAQFEVCARWSEQVKGCSSSCTLTPPIFLGSCVSRRVRDPGEAQKNQRFRGHLRLVDPDVRRRKQQGGCGTRARAAVLDQEGRESKCEGVRWSESSSPCAEGLGPTAGRERQLARPFAWAKYAPRATLKKEARARQRWSVVHHFVKTNRALPLMRFSSVVTMAGPCCCQSLSQLLARVLRKKDY